MRSPKIQFAFTRHLFLLPVLSALALGATADRPLLDFADPEVLRHAQFSDATARLVALDQRTGMRVETGQTATWPGVTLRFASPLDLSAYDHVQLVARNTGSETITLHLRVDNPGADGRVHCRTGSSQLPPGGTGRLRVELRRTSDDTLDGRLFGLRGYPVKRGGNDTLDPRQVTQVVVFLHEPKAARQFDLLELQAAGEYTPPTAWTSDADPYFPLIDTLGQYRHKDWPGKAKSVEDLARRREAESRQLERDRGPSGWNRFGGWADGPQLEATGFFRVQQHQGKWWFVDPEGRLFWSHGIDCVRMLDVTPIEERDAWFEDFPGAHPEFAEFIAPSAYALKGHYAGRSPRSFSFAGANLRRKYGPDWKQSYPETIHRRLRAWGLNTIANWSDRGVALMRRTPYTDSIGSQSARRVEGSEGYWGKFPDVFDPAFREGLRRQMAGRKGGSAGDPWCLGYFSDNEMSWGDETSLALAVLTSPSNQPAKSEFRARLEAKYGDIARLNQVWHTDYPDWDAFLARTNLPALEFAGADLRDFYTGIAEQYFRTVREAIREVAPQQLYLGCRFAWANARAAAAAAKYCDVVSYNLYQRGVADVRPPGAGDGPLLIGEFHFGALDRGLFHTGLVPVGNQSARAQAYRDYVRGALAHPQIVGTHWFQYQDEPTTGRVYDEENYQIGFVDIADTPYPETIEASRQVGDELYRRRAAAGQP
ncbi:MAG: beta-galactosidase [Verrucomicrobia bacterium]|nr:beta-galactosidase [Verrucomicrobiota bacterium]